MDNRYSGNDRRADTDIANPVADVTEAMRDALISRLCGNIICSYPKCACQSAPALARSVLTVIEPHTAAAQAAAVAAAVLAERAVEREKVAAFMMGRSLATGHGDTLEDLLIELGGQLDELRTGKWLPMETAPKNAMVLLDGPYADNPCVCQWQEKRPGRLAGWYVLTPEGNVAIASETDFSTDYLEFSVPDRWLPVPRFVAAAIRARSTQESGR